MRVREATGVCRDRDCERSLIETHRDLVSVAAPLCSSGSVCVRADHDCMAWTGGSLVHR